MKDLIKQYVDTGGQISEYQFNQLNDNLKKTYLRKRIIASKENPLVLFELLSLPKEIRVKYFNSLTPEEFEESLRKSSVYNRKNVDDILSFALSTQGFIEKIEFDTIDSILKYSTSPKKMVRIIGEKTINNYIKSTTKHFLERLIIDSKKPDEIIDIYGDMGKKFIDNLSQDDVRLILYGSKYPYEMIYALGEKGIEFFKKWEITILKRIFINQQGELVDLMVKYRPEDVPSLHKG